jgi:hypothetical protein
MAASALPDVHGLSLFKSSKLSGVYVPHFIRPVDVIRVLSRRQGFVHARRGTRPRRVDGKTAGD